MVGDLFITPFVVVVSAGLVFNIAECGLAKYTLVNMLYTEYIPWPKSQLKPSTCPMRNRWRYIHLSQCLMYANEIMYVAVVFSQWKIVHIQAHVDNSQVQWPSWAVIVSKSIACGLAYSAYKVIYKRIGAAHYDVMLIHYSYWLLYILVRVNFTHMTFFKL